MARQAFTVTLLPALTDGSQPVTSASKGVALDAALAAAVAIGAGDASAAVLAVQTQANAGDVQLRYNDATVTSYNKLKAAVDALLLQARSSGMV